MPSIYTQGQILDAVTGGDAVPTYARLHVQSSDGAHNGELLVFADALKLQGVRICVSAALEQQIADALGCFLLTPRLADLLWLARTAPLLPITGDVVNRTDEQQSEAIDAALAKIEDPIHLTTPIVQTVGKHWVISNQLLNHPGKAENYGWHFPGASFGGQVWEAAVTPGLRLIQGQGWAHDASHSDYSQIVCLVHRSCTFDGSSRDLADVLQDPVLSKLISHEGPLKLLRQPGIKLGACSSRAASPDATICPTPNRPMWRGWPWVIGAAGLAGLGLAWAYGKGK